jgi:c-di-GMP-binding flagellar brake protein YcgR
MQTHDDSLMENWHDFEVGSRREIVSLLRAIGEKNQLIRMLVRGEADVCVTTILEVDPDSDRIFLDCSIDPEQNRRILAAKRLSFETTLDRIRILFSSAGAQASTHEGGAALVMPIPQSLIRLQRREFYRMATPVINPVRATIPIPPELGGGSASVPLADISVGGVAILDHDLVLSNRIGHKYANCRITLPDAGVVTTGLQVRSSLDLTLLNDKPDRRLGCEFVDMSRANLALVQRYITRLERERNARTAGLS